MAFRSDINAVVVGQAVIIISGETGNQCTADLDAVTVVDGVDDFVCVDCIAQSLPHAHIVKGLDGVVERKELNSVGIADIDGDIVLLQLLRDSAVCGEAVNGAGLEADQQICRACDEFHDDGLQLRRRSVIIVVADQRDMILHFIFREFERTGSDRSKSKLAVVVGILRHDGLGGHGQEVRVSFLQGNHQRLVVLCLEGLDVVEAVQGIVDRELDGIQDVLCRYCAAVMEFYAVAESKGKGLCILRRLRSSRQLPARRFPRVLP